MKLVDVYEADPGHWVVELVPIYEWYSHGSLRLVTEKVAAELSALLEHQKRFRALCAQVYRQPRVEDVTIDEFGHVTKITEE